MTIRELAQALVGLTSEDELAVRDWAEVENAAFEAYADEYRFNVVLECKGCHGG
jgi:hypothetical protein